MYIIFFSPLLPFPPQPSSPHSPSPPPVRLHLGWNAVQICIGGDSSADFPWFKRISSPPLGARVLIRKITTSTVPRISQMARPKSTVGKPRFQWMAKVGRVGFGAQSDLSGRESEQKWHEDLEIQWRMVASSLSIPALQKERKIIEGSRNTCFSAVSLNKWPSCSVTSPSPLYFCVFVLLIFSFIVFIPPPPRILTTSYLGLFYISL